jgi:hypothetical protein
MSRDVRRASTTTRSGSTASSVSSTPSTPPPMLVNTTCPHADNPFETRCSTIRSTLRRTCPGFSISMGGGHSRSRSTLNVTITSAASRCPIRVAISRAWAVGGRASGTRRRRGDRPQGVLGMVNTQASSVLRPLPDPIDCIVHTFRRAGTGRGLSVGAEPGKGVPCAACVELQAASPGPNRVACPLPAASHRSLSPVSGPLALPGGLWLMWRHGPAHRVAGPSTVAQCGSH